MSVNDIPLALILQRQVPRRPPKRPSTYAGSSYYQRSMSWERPGDSWNKHFLPKHYQADSEVPTQQRIKSRRPSSKPRYILNRTPLGETNLRFWAAAPASSLRARGQCRMCLNFEAEAHFENHAAAFDCSNLLRKVYRDLLEDEKCGNCGRCPAKEQRWGIPFCNSGCMNAWSWNASAQGLTNEKNAIYGPMAWRVKGFCQRKPLEATA